MADSGPDEIKESGPALSERFVQAGIPVLVSIVLLTGGFFFYSFYRNFIEMFCIVIASGIFMITWNSRRHFENSYLLFIGVAFFFIAAFSFLNFHHILEKLFGSVPVINETMQMALAGSLIYSLSFLLAPFLVNRRIGFFRVFFVYGGISLLIVFSIFFWKTFPDCYRDGTGATTFQKSGEFMAGTLLLASALLLWSKKKDFDGAVLRYLLFSIGATLGSRLLFSINRSESDVLASAVPVFRDYLKLLSFYLLYKSIIVTGFIKPYRVLFRDLKMKEEDLIEAKNGLEKNVDKRTAELLSVTGILQQEIDEHSRAEEQLKKRTQDLNNRVRELNCLYSVGNLLRNPDLSLDGVFKSVIDLLPLGFEEPKFICGRIVFRNRGYKTSNYRETVWRRSCPIMVHDKLEGLLEIICLKENPGGTEDCPLINTHEDLINAVAKQLGESIEHREAEDALRVRERQQAAVAELGQKALAGIDTDKLLDAAVSLSAETLGADYCALHDFDDSPDLKTRKVNPRPVILKQALKYGPPMKSLDPVHSDGEKDQPLTVTNSARIIIGREKKPLGVLGAYNFRRKDFTPDDRHFLQAVGNVLAEALNRKETEEELQLFRDLIDRSSDALFVIDFQTGNIIDLNENACLSLGYARGELLGTHVSKILAIAPDNLGAVFREIKQNLTIIKETNHRRKDHSIFPVEVNIKYVSKGKKEYLVCVVRDVTARRQAEQERMRLAAAVESTADEIVIADTEGRIQYVNPAFERISGYEKEEVTGLSLFEISGNDALNPDLLRSLREGDVWIGRTEGKRRDGNIYQEESTIAPVLNSAGDVLNYVMVKRDITEKLKLESIAEAVNTMENIGYIFSGIRHEIGNPVNSIKTALSVLRGRLDNCPREIILQYIERSIVEVTRMEYLLQALKSFNMYENLDLKNIDLAKFLKQFFSLVRPDLEMKKIKLDLDCSSHRGYAFADPRALQQVLLNVITNGMDAVSGAEVPRIGITLFSAKEMTGIRVEDNGCGMNEKQLKELFMPFYTTKPHGTGLGLVIAKKMLTRMKGVINLYSREGKGTTVEIMVPASPGEA